MDHSLNVSLSPLLNLIQSGSSLSRILARKICRGIRPASLKQHYGSYSLSQFDLCFEVVGSHTLNFRSHYGFVRITVSFCAPGCGAKCLRAPPRGNAEDEWVD